MKLIKKHFLYSIIFVAVILNAASDDLTDKYDFVSEENAEIISNVTRMLTSLTENVIEYKKTYKTVPTDLFSLFSNKGSCNLIGKVNKKPKEITITDESFLRNFTPDITWKGGSYVYPGEIRSCGYTSASVFKNNKDNGLVDEITYNGPKEEIVVNRKINRFVRGATMLDPLYSGSVSTETDLTKTILVGIGAQKVNFKGKESICHVGPVAVTMNTRLCSKTLRYVANEILGYGKEGIKAVKNGVIEDDIHYYEYMNDSTSDNNSYRSCSLFIPAVRVACDNTHDILPYEIEVAKKSAEMNFENTNKKYEDEKDSAINTGIINEIPESELVTVEDVLSEMDKKIEEKKAAINSYFNDMETNIQTNSQLSD